MRRSATRPRYQESPALNPGSIRLGYVNGRARGDEIKRGTMGAVRRVVPSVVLLCGASLAMGVTSAQATARVVPRPLSRATHGATGGARAVQPRTTPRVGTIVGDGLGTYCAVLIPTGAVDCWGYGANGQLGDGQFYVNGPLGVDTPTPVVGVGGSGQLSGVQSLADSNGGNGFCALLRTHRVDCWGAGSDGQLGNGRYYTSGEHGSAAPVAVKGVGGTGTLSDVNGLEASSTGYCALLASTDVDCWGDGQSGQLGNGGRSSSDLPVEVKGVGGHGLLDGVESLTCVTCTGGEGGAYCALLTSHDVDCWGWGVDGELGNGRFYTAGDLGSPVPVPVKGVGGTGVLSGVAHVTGDDAGACALLTSGDVDCWGYGVDGQLGDGQDYQSGNDGSALPVAVKRTSGSGDLSGVASLAGTTPNEESGTDYCAVLTSGGIDCWGSGAFGQLGNGQFSQGADRPVAVKGTGGVGLLSGARSVVFDGDVGACAVVTDSRVVCWGYGYNGQLGDAQFYAAPNLGSAVPVTVVASTGVGSLNPVQALASGGSGDGACAVRKEEAFCWGYGPNGQLGDGQLYNVGKDGSAVPVEIQ